jgi:anti-sigma factor RsiW
MTHDEIRERIHAYVDGELDAMDAREVEQHLGACDDCRRAEQGIRALHEALSRSAPAYRAPAELKRNVRAALRREEKSEREPFGGWWAWSAGAVFAALLLTFAVFQFQGRAGNAIADQVVANHVRSLLATHLVDVPSSDRHTVKPWFNGKIDFAPPVVDLAREGFPLEGGRVDYIGGRVVAALVYKRQSHVINLFVWPASPDAAATTVKAIASRDGYNIENWRSGGLNFWAVSDVSANDLAGFRDAFSARAGK